MFVIYLAKLDQNFPLPFAIPGCKSRANLSTHYMRCTDCLWIPPCEYAEEE